MAAQGSDGAPPARRAHVIEELGARIVRGELSPDTTMPTEDVLVNELGVGRSALREGVKVLLGKGLLESRTSAGTRVRPRESWNLLDADILTWRFSSKRSSIEDIRVIADLRVVLEPGAARLAAESTDPAGRRAVAHAMANLEAAVDDVDEFVQADIAFHRAIFEATGNDLLLYVHDAVSTALRAVRPLHTHSFAHYSASLVDHARVAAAIGKRHHRKAEEAMRALVEKARQDALREASTTDGLSAENARLADSDADGGPTPAQ